MRQPQHEIASGLSRRSVVRAAAWSVPAITMASAAPAFAASGLPTGRLRIPQFSGSRNVNLLAPSTFTVSNLQIRNDGPDAVPVGVLVFTIVIPSAWGNVVAWGGGSNNPPPEGWTISGYGSRALTITAHPRTNGLAAGQSMNVADRGFLGARNLVFTTSDNRAGTWSEIHTTVSTNQVAPNAFSGASRSATISLTSIWV